MARLADLLLPRTLRGRLTVVITTITLFAAGATFLVIDRSAEAELQSRIDDELRSQLVEWEQYAAGRDLGTPQRTARVARGFIDSQSYHPRSRIFLFTIRGDGVVSNEPELLEEDGERPGEESGERGGAGEETGGLLRAPLGLHTVSASEAGKLRVLSGPIEADGERVGVFRIADPLRSVEDALAGIRASLLLVGAVAGLLAIGAAAWIATVTARPLRRIADLATAVDAGDLSPRIGPVRAGEEIRALAGAFDRMLDRLQRAFARQRDFVSDASHELRTPLTILRGQIELLVRGEGEGDRRREALEVITREIDRMNALVDDLLTLASAEGGELVAAREIDVVGFVEDLSRDLPLFGPRRYRSQSTVTGTLHADPERLTQVVRNLVRNAVTHTKADDEVALTVRAADRSLEFAISDTGPGIPPDQLGLVFDRFHRARGSRVEGGSGLGLAIAKAIVDAHGGSIWAESRPGEGTTIRFRVPGYRPCPITAASSLP
jgi:two-component system, OmpR family, sensor kinase